MRNYFFIPNFYIRTNNNFRYDFFELLFLILFFAGLLPSYAWFDLISIIAFSSKASLYITTDENTEIIYIREILSVIKSYNNIKFSSEQVKEICDAIYWANVTDKDIRNNHKYVVQQKIYNRNTLVDAGICPNCGAELVERQGRYGSFTGCSRYPKCKFTTK